MADEIQSRLHAASQVGRFAHTMHVHEVDVRVVPEEVVVQRRDIDSVIQERGHHRVHFFLQEHQITHHDVRTVGTLRQRNPAAESKRRGRRETLDGHLQVTARDVDLENARLEITLPVEKS